MFWVLSLCLSCWSVFGCVSEFSQSLRFDDADADGDADANGDGDADANGDAGGDVNDDNVQLRRDQNPGCLGPDCFHSSHLQLSE